MDARWEEKYMHVLDLLAPRFKNRTWNLVNALYKEEITLVPYFGLRDPWTQARYWRRSRSAAECEEAIRLMREQGYEFLAGVMEEVGPQSDGPWATDALPGLSWHQHGQGLDLYPENENGSANWDGNSWEYRRLARSCVLNNLTSGFFWKKHDAGHVQGVSFSVLHQFGYSVPVLDKQVRHLWEPGEGMLWLQAVKQYAQDLEGNRDG